MFCRTHFFVPFTCMLCHSQRLLMTLLSVHIEMQSCPFHRIVPGFIVQVFLYSWITTRVCFVSLGACYLGVNNGEVACMRMQYNISVRSNESMRRQSHVHDHARMHAHTHTQSHAHFHAGRRQHHGQWNGRQVHLQRQGLCRRKFQSKACRAWYPLNGECGISPALAN